MTSEHAKKNEKVPVTLGIVAAPDLAEDIAYSIKERLPDLLARYVSGKVSWEIEIVTDPLTGATANSTEIVNEIKSWKQDKQWEYAICITDLPLFINKQLVVADANVTHNVAWISLPSLGSTPMIRRVREAILQLINEMFHGSSDSDRDQQQQKVKNTAKHNTEWRGRGSRQLIGERLSERLSPISRIRPSDETDVDVRFIVKSRFSGGVRMLSGMVRANRPWTVFPSFKRVVAAAFATGAYGLIFPTLWQISGAYETYRFFLLMFAAMGAMVIWLIVAHGLWEKPSKAEAPYLAKLYNAATALTLSIAVLFYYAVLFILFLLAVVIFVPGSMLESQLGEPVGLGNYVALAWLASSVATIAGALGAALESEETVLNATYGYRQKRRYEKIKERKEKNQ